MIRTKEKAPVKSRGQKAEPIKGRGRGRPPSGKIMVNLRLDPDIIEAFRATGKGWQARMNEALRKAMP